MIYGLLMMTLLMPWRLTHKSSKYNRGINKKRIKGNRVKKKIRKQDLKIKRRKRKLIYRNFRTNSLKVGNLKSNGDLDLTKNFALQ